MDTMLSAPPERKFGKLIVVAAVLGAGAAVALAFLLPTQPPKGKNKKREQNATAPPPAPVTKPAPPVGNPEEAQRLLIRARNAQEPDEQFALVGKALEANPASWEAFAFRAQLYEQRRQLDKAIDDWTAAIAVHPEPASLYERRAEYAARLRRHRQSADDYGRAAEWAARADLYVRRGVQRLLAGDRSEAIPDFDKAVELDALMVEAVASRAAALALDARGDDALKAVAAALALDPLNPTAHLARACVYGRRALDLAEESSSSGGVPSDETVRKVAHAASMAVADALVVATHDLLALLEKHMTDMESRLTAWDGRGVKVSRALSTELAERGAERPSYGDKLFALAAKRDASNALPHVLHGFQKWAGCCDVEICRPHLDRAERLAPGQPEVRGLRGFLTLHGCMRSVAALANGGAPVPRRGEPTPDPQWLKTFLTAYPDIQDYLSHASSRAAVGALEKALTEFAGMLVEAKVTPPPSKEVALRLVEQSEAERSKCLDCAMGMASRAIAVDARCAAAWSSRGKCNAAASRWAEAVKDWEKAVELDGELRGELEPLIEDARKK